MARNRPGSGGPRAEASRRYRATFAAKHGGVGFNQAGALARTLGLQKGSRSKAVAEVASTREGVDLLSYQGSNVRRQGLREAALKAADLRARELDALGAIRRGEVPGAAAAERRYQLPAGSLRRDFGSEAARTGHTEAGAAMRVVSTDGVQLRAVEGQADRDLIGEHYRAVQLALQGKPGRLRQLRGRRVAGLTLETDLARLRAMADAGLLAGGPYVEQRSGRAGA